MKIKLLVVTSMAIAAFSGCGSGVDTFNGSTANGYVQVERLGRPAINEGLVLSNANLNLWNSRAPSTDGDSTFAASGGIQSEVVAVLTAINTASTAAGHSPPSVATVAGMFLPDTLRIDVSKTVAPATAAYNSCLGGGGTSFPLCGGRKITDDVANITLSFLALGDPSGSQHLDGITSYTAAGHQAVLASFPYLAAPN